MQLDIEVTTERPDELWGSQPLSLCRRKAGLCVNPAGATTSSRPHPMLCLSPVCSGFSSQSPGICCRARLRRARIQFCIGQMPLPPTLT